MRSALLLLSPLVALFVVSVARRTQRELSSQIEEKGLALEGDRKGLLRIELSTASMGRVWRSQLLAAMVLGLAVLGLGILGLAAIFYTQHRHLAEVKALEAEVERREQFSTLGNMDAVVGLVEHEARGAGIRIEREISRELPVLHHGRGHRTGHLPRPLAPCLRAVCDHQDEGARARSDHCPADRGGPRRPDRGRERAGTAYALPADAACGRDNHG